MGGIAIVGSGPTGIYAFQQLIEARLQGHVTIFEKGEKLGIGMPYSPETSSKSMLANIASVEIPPVVTTYLEWLEEKPKEMLRSYGLDPDDLDDRMFTPRLLLGEYFHDQLMVLITRAQTSGINVDIREKTEVLDVRALNDGLALVLGDEVVEGPFDRVILATGHDFPDADEATRNYFPSPWSGLIKARVPAVRIGIMGTSLSSIDAAMAVANQHGHFRRKGGELRFVTSANSLHITLMSWTGVLPEADFYCPLPYEPLHIMTDAALANSAAQGHTLDGIFSLFTAEITQADPGYAARIGLADLTADSFSAAYFAERERQDPFRFARKNLDEVEYNKAKKITVPWRYAILRMHEKVEGLITHLDDTDRERFDNGLKRVFVDNYAAVPSESIRRLLALHDAGVLLILSLGDDYELETKSDHTQVKAKGSTHVFDVFIDARGQKALSSADIPFPTLRHALLEAGQHIPELAEDYRLTGVPGFEGNLVLAAIPYLMHERPFVQGITASAEIGAAIAAAVSTGKRRRWA